MEQGASFLFLILKINFKNTEKKAPGRAGLAVEEKCRVGSMEEVYISLKKEGMRKSMKGK